MGQPEYFRIIHLLEKPARVNLTVTFLASWQLALFQKNYRQNRIADLLLEAVFLQNGSQAVGTLARKWQEEQPRGYLYWLQQPEREKNWLLLRDAGLETLGALPSGRNRVEAADFLIPAPSHLGDETTSLIGFRERFRSKPGDSTLLDLLTEANHQQVCEQELQKVCIFCTKTEPKYGEQLLLIKALLMAGNFAQAFDFGKQEESYDWSHSTTDLLFASTLYLLCGGNKTCSISHRQLEEYGCCNAVFLNSYSTLAIKECRSGFEEIKHGLDLARTNSNTHRSSYDRAAKVLVSLAEVMAVNGDKKQAQALLHEYCKVLYNRHTAFRQEVRVTVGRSKILGGLGGGV